MADARIGLVAHYLDLQLDGRYGSKQEYAAAPR